MPSKSLARSSSNSLVLNIQSCRKPARKRRLDNSVSGGSLQTSYRQPRPSTSSLVHASVKLTRGLVNRKRGLTSTTVGPASDSSKKSGT
jgi:hypothetical protein